MTKRIWVGLVLAAVASAAHADLALIVNPKNPATSLTADQVAQVYLGRSASFPQGGAATPLDHKEGSPQRDEFYAKVADKNPGQVKAYWAKLMFSGKAQPPRELASSAEVKRAVAADASAIGYIEKSALDGSVKSVLVVP
jgi:ABC-type phosphate transport system substrate-binding protein